MVRKSVFPREDVIAAGVRVIEQDGLAGLSARRVAEVLGASTAPVYSNFASMEELAVAAKNAVTDRLLEFTTRHFTGDAFLDIGIGILEFARQKPSLYSAIFMQDATHCQAGPRVMACLTERMASLDGLSTLPASERIMLLHQMSIFTHGLAVRICSGLTGGVTFADLIILLKDAGGAMTRHAFSQPERTAEEKALIEALTAYNAKEKTDND